MAGIRSAPALPRLPSPPPSRLMDRDALRQLLVSVGQGALPVEAALERLATLPMQDLGYAHLDTHRALRTGDPEVVYGEGKTVDQVAGILLRLAQSGQDGLATRLSPEKGEQVRDRLLALGLAPGEVRWHASARLMQVRVRPDPELVGNVLVVCAGTSDLPVADEAALVAQALGAAVFRLTDVGVAGIHRLLGKAELLRQAHVIIVVAGMEGALASVVAGLVKRPVIAVPTSVGYGASFGGVAALLGMLNSCAAGVSVVNIDNGFGAALTAVRINRLAVGEADG